MRKAQDRRLSNALRVALFAILSLLSLLLPGCSSFDAGAGNFNTVVVDAGHGGYDRGARAVSGTPEKMLAIDTAQRLTRILRSKGFHVIETRQSDVFIPLGSRTAVSNRAGGAIFVSIHYNWSPRTAARGIEIYYYGARSRRLASHILRETLRAYPTVNRGVKRNNYYVLRNNRRPAVLCELGFLSNPQDNRYAQNPSYRQHLAERVAAGIIAERKGLGF